MLLPLAGGSGAAVSLGELMMILELHRQGLKASAIARQRDRGPSTRPTSPDVDKVLRALDRMEAGPTGDELASRMEADRRRDVEARNAVGAAESRRYAQQLKRGGYAGWAEGQR